MMLIETTRTCRGSNASTLLASMSWHDTLHRPRGQENVLCLCGKPQQGKFRFRHSSFMSLHVCLHGKHGSLNNIQQQTPGREWCDLHSAFQECKATVRYIRGLPEKENQRKKKNKQPHLCPKTMDVAMLKHHSTLPFLLQDFFFLKLLNICNQSRDQEAARLENQRTTSSGASSSFIIPLHIL